MVTRWHFTIPAAGQGLVVVAVIYYLTRAATCAVVYEVTPAAVTKAFLYTLAVHNCCYQGFLVHT